ncbi:MAG: N-acetylmuramoyl-L-alanine amidase, partial [Clostridia bacterium]|nr:N-acetylmuramoyl-L-alanine amidase [Clostridia bacterium]
MFVFKRKNLIILGVFVLVIIAFSVCLSALVKVPAASDDTRLTVVIDAGHGGIDYGVSGIKTGVKESELNLKISRKLGNYFNTAKIKVVYTRNSDAGLYGLATKNRKKKDMQKR